MDITRYINLSFLATLLLVFGILINQYNASKIVWHHSEAEAMESLLQIYQAEWQWHNSDIDNNSVKDFWVRDVAGLFFYNRPQTGKSIKLIPKDIAVADMNPFFEFYRGNHFEKLPYKGYYFKMATYDENGMYQAKKDIATNIAYCDSKFCVIAYPAFNKKLRTFIINSDKKIIFRKIASITEADKWPADVEKEGWEEFVLELH